MNINESEHPLVTPEFIGTDEEKMAVLSYWSDLIGLVRSLNACVISHQNKLSIILQMQKELTLIGLEVNNTSAAPVSQQNGSIEMNQDTTPKTTGPDEIVIDLGKPDVQEAENPYAKFERKDIPVAEAMKRLAGTWYQNPKK
jgi:hypothetical protein